MPADARLLVLDGPTVETLLDPDAVLEATREAFRLHSERKGRVFPVVRERLKTGGVFGVKSGDVEAEGLLGFKAAGFWPNNRAVGGEPHQATVMLINPATGRPLALIDGNAITTARTGAAGGIGLVELARPGARRICIFGTGVQARVQLATALRLRPELDEVRYVTSSGKPSPYFEAMFDGDCVVTHGTDSDQEVADADVVITATPGGGPLFSVDAVQPGTHITAVGADTAGKRELAEGLLARARLFVDDAEQSRSIGEGQWAPDRPSIELGDVLTGRAKAERHPEDITVFDMTGLALQDLTVARMLLRRAAGSGAGLTIPWPW